MPLTIEEIESRLNEASSEEERLELMNEFSYFYKTIYPDYSRTLAVEALARGHRLGWRRGVALALANLGFREVELARFDDAALYLYEAERIMRELKGEEQRGLNRILNAIGCIHLEKADYESAALCFREALNLSEESNDTLLISKIYTNLCYIYGSLKQFERALDYALLALKKLESNKDHFTRIIALNNTGNTLRELGRYEEALDYLRRSYKLASAQEKSALKGPTLHSLGLTYLDMGDYGRAEKYLHQGLESPFTRRVPFHKMKALAGLGRLCKARGELKRALSYWQEALDIGREKDLINSLPDVITPLYETYMEMGRYKKALSYLEHFDRLKDKKLSLDMESALRNVEAESLKRANEKIKVISAIGRELTSTLDMESLLDIIYSKVNSMMDATIFGIASIDRKGRRVRFDKYIKDGEHLPTFYSMLNDKRSLTAYAISNRTDVIINDIYHEFSYYLEGEVPNFLAVGEDNKRANSLLITPLIVEERVTGVVTVQSYRKGAYSYSDLDSLKALASYIAVALKNARQAELIRQKNEKLNRLAVTDYLTGVYNRREFEERLNRIWIELSEKGESLSILLLDADHFKNINDSYGHPAGDECLRQLANLLNSRMEGELNCTARYGGEEFIILYNAGRAAALKLAETIRAAIEESPVLTGESSIMMTVSIGVSTTVPTVSEVPRGAEQLISRADEALYRSKVEGRNRVTYLDFL